jgi:RNA polymerase sigma factor (sigma-70 family)
MGRFRIAQVADFARQMQFTPSDVRGRQLTAAEELLLQLEPAKAYPFAFIVFRITGYHPKESADGLSNPLLTGMALQHDLGELIEMVSDTLNLRIDQVHEPVLAIEQVAEYFNVSDRSLQRWRRRGLAARRFIFPDGKKRVAFLASSVERFFSRYRDGVARSANFSPITDDERAHIIRRATMLAAAGCWTAEILRRIGRRMNRSPLMVKHVLQQHDQTAARPILTAAPLPPTAAQREALVRAFSHGSSLADLAADFALPRSAVYRVLLDHRLARIFRPKLRFIDDPLYHQPDAGRVIDDIVQADDVTEPSPRRPGEQLALSRALPPYLQSLCSYPLLSLPRERSLFLKLHFHKFQFVTLRRKLESRAARWRDLDQLESHLRLAQQTKNQIVAANLRLVVSVARKHVRGNLTLMDLVSDGNIALMRAVDAYDFHRGNRFSSYATLALMKGYARSVPRRALRQPVLPLEEVPDLRSGQRARLDQRDEVRQLLSGLCERERTVLRAHFHVTDEHGNEPVSLDELTRQLRLTKQRVHQIERAALAKLRAAAHETERASEP